MKELGPAIVMLGILSLLWVLLRRDFVKGLAFAVFLWVSMTTYLRIQIPGIPALTIHRLMLMVTLLVWVSRTRWSEIKAAPLLGCFVFWFLANAVSLAGTQAEFGMCLRRFLDFVLESFLFYIVIATMLKDEDDALRVLRAAWLGLLVVAFFAVVERWTRFNPVDSFIPGYVRDEGARRDTLSTYEHRILLGTAMAMGISLTFAVTQAWRMRGRKPRFFWVAMGLLCAASYFSFSRGPWVGLVLAGGWMFLASPPVRKKLVLLGTMALLVLVARPGVVKTLTGFAEDSVDKKSFKGGTLQYRLELWAVAFHEVSKSPWRLFFGYGPGAGNGNSVDWELSYTGKEYAIESWDNEFAYSLYQSGFVGMTATMLLYLGALWRLYRMCRQCPRPARDMYVCVLATAVILVWMMTNVLVFAKQLDYLFWTVIAAGFAIGRSYEEKELSEAQDGEAAEQLATNQELVTEPLP